jgi:hypothetical protein
MFGVGRLMRTTLLPAAAWIVVQAGPAAAFNVNLSLDVFPTLNANPGGGGSWALYATTDSASGIAGIDSFIKDIGTAGISYGPGINAALNGGNPYVTAGSPVELLYFQDVSMPGIVVGVGSASFSPGLDPLGDPTWNDATKIATGTYGATVPVFAPKGALSTSANVFSTNAPPFNHSLAATTTPTVRVALSGDYNLNGVVDAADYTVWRDKLGSGTSLRNDNTAGVGSDDYIRWKANFGTVAGSGSTAASAAPEPATISLLMLGVAVGFLRRRNA